MVKNAFSLVAIIILLASCSSIKPLQFTSNKQVVSETSNAQENGQAGKQVQFIEDISVTPAATPAESKISSKKEAGRTRGLSTTESNSARLETNSRSSVESASRLQLKYSILLNTEVESLQNTALLEKMDEWYGTRYRLGGTTKKGIDCSAFVQSVFIGAYAISLPRTAREQYKASRRISRTDLQEGDLLFFNTTGGVSHVGIYLQNNKFIHASASQGVTISDLFDPYYLKRFIGAGRVEDKQTSLTSN
jgi:cell wall-associated NlpC family hydrolase